MEDVEPPAPDVYGQLAETLQGDQVVPVLLGGAEKDHGVQRLLKTLRHEAPGVAATRGSFPARLPGWRRRTPLFGWSIMSRSASW